MSDQQPGPEDLWLAYCHAEQEADEALRLFLATVSDPIGFLGTNLRHTGRVYALRVLERFPEEDRRRLLPDLVAVAATTVRDLRLVRAAIASFDRRWLQSNIEGHVWKQLGPEASDEQYRRLAELLDGLGLAPSLEKLLDRAAASPDQEIRQVAADWRA
jgi:hypothetical protein